MVSDHDFFILGLGKVTPYGVYILNNNAAFVNRPVFSRKYPPLVVRSRYG